MTRYLFIFITGVFALIIFSQCDKIDTTDCCDPEVVVHPPTDTIRKILLEDYTGHLCVNCPRAAEIAHELKERYDTQLIVIAVHSGPFAIPVPSLGFTEDFRTTEGDELNTYFGISNAGNPNGMVNRNKINGNIIVGKDNWGSVIDPLSLEKADASISIENKYNTANRSVDITLSSTFFTQLAGEYKLCVYIIEDNITNWQTTPTGNDPNYLHRHVLRGSANGTWGEELTTSVAVNSAIEKSYSYTLDAGWDENNCSVVAYIYRSDDKDASDNGPEKHVIIQAEEEHI